MDCVYINLAARTDRRAAIEANFDAHKIRDWSLARFEEAVVRLPLAEQRAALNTLGAPLCLDTYGTGTPRHGFRRES